MPHALLSLAAAVIYLGVGMIYLKHLLSRDPANTQAPRFAWGLVLSAVIVHAVALYASIVHANTVALGITNAASLVTWVIVVLFLLSALTQPIHNLGALLMPVAAAAVIVQWLWRHR